jgi:DNA polymerase III subunit epsilon
MREIILDTETTGLKPKDGHKIVEIACVELFNTIPTGKEFHVYINPQRDMPDEAFRVHGLSYDFLKDKPLFEHIAQDFLDFIQNDPLVIHNAPFDMGFLRHELHLVRMPTLETIPVVDTLQIARRKFPGSPASLDALCKRFNVDRSMRDKHGALIDCNLLAQVYLELMGGRQKDLAFVHENNEKNKNYQMTKRDFLEPRSFEPSPQELENHQNFLSKIKNPLWNKA